MEKYLQRGSVGCQDNKFRDTAIEGLGSFK